MALLEGVMKQMIVQGHTLRLVDEGREPGISNARKPENQDSQHMHAESTQCGLSLNVQSLFFFCDCFLTRLNKGL